MRIYGAVLHGEACERSSFITIYLSKDHLPNWFKVTLKSRNFHRFWYHYDRIGPITVGPSPRCLPSPVALHRSPHSIWHGLGFENIGGSSGLTVNLSFWSYLVRWRRCFHTCPGSTPWHGLNLPPVRSSYSSSLVGWFSSYTLTTVSIKLSVCCSYWTWVHVSN